MTNKREKKYGRSLNESILFLTEDKVQVCEGYKLIESFDIEGTLRRETNNFQRQSGGLDTDCEEEKNEAKKVLERNGYQVEVSDGRISDDDTTTWHIEFYK